MFADNTENTFIAIILIAEFVDFVNKPGLLGHYILHPLTSCRGGTWGTWSPRKDHSHEKNLQKIVEFTDCRGEMMKLLNGNKFLIHTFSV